MYRLRIRASIATSLVVILSVLVGACTGVHKVAKAKKPTNPVTIVSALTKEFLKYGMANEYGLQWNVLAPLARSVWPSKEARAAMLTAKFSVAKVSSFKVGKPSCCFSWVDRETLSTRSGLWRVPVSLVFSNSSAIKPTDVSRYYYSMYIYVQLKHGIAQVVGEGPYSIDAPIIEPATIPNFRANVPVLMYHRVAPYPVPSAYATYYGYELDYGLTVSPQEFAGQISYLAENGYHAISLTRLADYLLYGLPLPSKPVIFTFDDGRLSPYINAVPLLLKYHFTATFFVPAGLIGAYQAPQRYMTASDLKTLVKDGFWVEDHTMYDNVYLWGISYPYLKVLAGESRHILENITGEDIQFIAYTGLWPYTHASETGPEVDQMFSWLQTMGYVGGVVDARTDSASETTQGLWNIPRIRMIPNWTTQGFAALLNELVTSSS